ncbi:MAG: SRPBCC family protein [Woeseiaceae bacterium]|nr:SRPBCC family protein [Woeseiaceae bacterium]
MRRRWHRACAHVDDALDRYGLADAEDQPPQEAGKYGWNWKVMFENNNDGYHANKLHQGPLHDFVPEFDGALSRPARRHGRLLPLERHAASGRQFQHHATGAAADIPQPDGRRPLADGVRQHPADAVAGADRRHGHLPHPARRRAGKPRDGHGPAAGRTARRPTPVFRHKMAVNMAGAEEIMAQDWHVDEMVQVGLRSRFAPRGRYSWQEGAQHDFNNWLVPRYKSCWERIRSGQDHATGAAARSR